MLEPEAIAHQPLFEPLRSDQREQLLAAARVLALPQGEPLFQRGERARHFYLVLEGTMKLFLLSQEGEEKVVEVMQPGDTFAEAVMFMEAEAYPVNATALTPARVAAFPSAIFLQALRENPELALRMLGTVSRRLHALLRQINELSLQDAMQRVAAYILALRPEGADRVELELPKQVIASRLGIKPETLSRTLGNLRDRGLLAVHGDTILLHDPAALQDLLRH